MKREIAEFREKYGIDRITCCYTDRGIEQLADLLAYRAERAQYALWRECCDDLTWEEYLCFLHDSAQMQESARRVLLKAQRNFGADQFDFDAPGTEESGEPAWFVRLLEGEQAEAIVVLFLFKAELAHHRRLSAVRGESYALERYMQELRTDKALDAALRTGFERAVRQLDFRKAWIQVGFDFPADVQEE